MKYLLFLAFVYSGPLHSSPLQAVNFFENSQRRDLEADKKRWVLRAVKKGQKKRCSSFLVENTQNRWFVATGKHCFDDAMEKQCLEKNVEFLPANRSGVSFVGRCQNVIIEDPRDDIVIVEIEILNRHRKRASNQLKQKLRENYQALRLSSYIPPVGFRLQLLGFPRDRIRQGEATISENCWVMPPGSPTPIQVIPQTEWDQEYLDFYRQRSPSETPHLLGHNCSVYGGNSGGPIILENTLDVIGLPSSYYPGLYAEAPSTTSHSFDEMYLFVKKHRTLLEQNGIVISEQINWISGTFSRLRAWGDGIRVFSDQDVCGLKLSVDLQNGEIKTQYIDKNGQCPQVGAEFRWFCTPDHIAETFCVHATEEEKYWTLRSLNSRSIEMSNPQGDHRVYRRTREI